MSTLKGIFSIGTAKSRLLVQILLKVSSITCVASTSGLWSFTIGENVNKNLVNLFNEMLHKCNIFQLNSYISSLFVFMTWASPPKQPEKSRSI